MKVLIIEDEHLAAQRMKDLVLRYDASTEICGILGSVKKTVDWLNEHKHPDLIFLDIQLADGLSFEIFEQTRVESMVIFTTAFNEYAIRAFKHNSVDYILKPIDFEELSTAIDKYKTRYRQNTSSNAAIPAEAIDRVWNLLTQKHKERFVVKVGLHIKTIMVTDILYFYSLEKSTFCSTTEGKVFDLDYTLDQIENLISPQLFFRINRKFLVNINSIIDIIVFSNSRLRLKLKHSTDDDIIVSREKVSDFKKWLDR